MFIARIVVLFFCLSIRVYPNTNNLKAWHIKGSLKEKVMATLNGRNVVDIEVDGVDTSDYPDFCDAFIESAEIDGVELTDAEIEELNCNSEFVYNCVLKELF